MKLVRSFAHPHLVADVQRGSTFGASPVHVDLAANDGLRGK